MSIKVVLKAFLDGFAQCLIFLILGAYIVSPYAQHQSLEQYMLINALGAIFSAIIYLLFLNKQLSNKTISVFSISSIIWSVLIVAGIFGIYLLLPNSVLSVRTLNNADGILILFANGAYWLLSIFLRFVLFLILSLRNICKSNRGKINKKI